MKAAIETNRHRSLNETTIAEFNKVSIKDHKKHPNASAPFRIVLPDFFNIPAFEDHAIKIGEGRSASRPVLKDNALLKKRIKDLSVLAEGMKRAKNTKEQSRFYFTLGVLLHNNEEYQRSIEYFQKFLRNVIVLGDSKSVELSLNVIGCQYMYLGDFQKAIEFHKKQVESSTSPDKFISLANIGFCKELSGSHQQAYSTYQLLKDQLENMPIQSPELLYREKLFERLINRTEKKILESEVFMTEKVQLSPSKSLKSSFIKEESSMLMKKVTNRKEYESAKINYAVSAAEENIDEYLKSSFKG